MILYTFREKNTGISVLKQRSIKTVTSATGVGLHSGDKVTMTLRPAAPDTGIVFRRTDLPQPNEIKVQPDIVGDTRLCTALVREGPCRHGRAFIVSAGRLGH